jgi:hypothetical protein
MVLMVVVVMVLVMVVMVAVGVVVALVAVVTATATLDTGSKYDSPHISVNVVLHSVLLCSVYLIHS